MTHVMAYIASRLDGNVYACKNKEERDAAIEMCDGEPYKEFPVHQLIEAVRWARGTGDGATEQEHRVLTILGMLAAKGYTHARLSFADGNSFSIVIRSARCIANIDNVGVRFKLRKGTKDGDEATVIPDPDGRFLSGDGCICRWNTFSDIRDQFRSCCSKEGTGYRETLRTVLELILECKEDNFSYYYIDETDVEMVGSFAIFGHAFPDGISLNEDTAYPNAERCVQDCCANLDLVTGIEPMQFRNAITDQVWNIAIDDAEENAGYSLEIGHWEPCDE